MFCTRVNRSRSSKANSSLGVSPQPVVGSLMSGRPFHDQLGRPLARHARPATREARQHGAVPEANDALLEQPLALGLDQLIVVVAGEAQGVGRLTATLCDEGEGLHRAALAAAFDD